MHRTARPPHARPSTAPAPNHRAEGDLFSPAWAALRAAVADKNALLIGKGRWAPTGGERTELGSLEAKLTLSLG
ncbi:hypothetical protein OG250_31605 [Streptomyces sp. NBC_00487]|uniref:hypothetical protein n=1 Tax=unclassified Streptomyces TaxID=2593676 RepID=UPI002E1804E9|nr:MULTISPECIES: hypothetical protein [unclassified Streptomyces]